MSMSAPMRSLSSRADARRFPPAAGAPRAASMPRPTPLAAALAALLVAGGLAAPAQAGTGGAWFAQGGVKQAPGMNPALRMQGGVTAQGRSTAQQQAASRQKLQRSIDNLNRTAGAIAALHAAQDAARQAAAQEPALPDGLADGGLKVDADPLTAGWLNAQAPMQTVAGGKTTVTVQQTADKAILNWETFNVGRNTTVDFQQQAAWAVLNRVNDPQARPSQIQGRIKGAGTVMVANRNGVVFSGSSQVNVRNLVVAAARIDDAQFQNNGLYGADVDSVSFYDAAGAVQVQAGARIATHEPGSVTDGGGYVLLMGTSVDNAGQIVTRRGQTALAAGDRFYIRKGMGTDANTHATTRGNEVAGERGVVGSDEQGDPVYSASGTVSNTGLILAREGDVTLTGHDVRQQGAAIATTTVNTRGTIHLLNSASDAHGRITLGANATTAVLLEDDGQTALNSQRDALIQESGAQDVLRAQAAAGRFDNYSKLTDRRDQSRIEIASGGSVVFEGDSLTLATGGQIVADARGRSYLAERAQVDVAGAVGVRVAMESNNVQVNVQGNELRDAPLNRDTGRLANSNVWVDRRNLTLVEAGTNGYESDRWYTAGGLLEVGGYLGNQGHTIGEWAAQGGTVTLAGSEVITQAGSVVNLSGGTLDVQTGYINLTWLRGLDGRLHNLSDAPADFVYRGLYQGYEATHARWGDGATRYFYNPLIAPTKRLEPGYTAGRDAGRLVVGAAGVFTNATERTMVTAVLQGDIDASVYQGARQTRAPQAAADGYSQSQTAVARPGGLAVLTPLSSDSDTPLRDWQAANEVIIDVAAALPAVPASAELSLALEPDTVGTVWLDADRLSAAGLGSLMLRATERVAIEAPLTLAPGADLTAYAATIDVNGGVTAPGGSVLLTNLLGGTLGQLSPSDASARPAITLGPDARIDTRGLWGNLQRDPGTAWRQAYTDGGAVTLRSTGDVTLAAGSRIDASSGAFVTRAGTLDGGAGGDITLVASQTAFLLPTGVSEDPGNHGDLTLEGTLASSGFTRGGALVLQTGGILSIGGSVEGMGDTLQAGRAAPYTLYLSADVTVHAGAELPIDWTARLDTVPAGGTLPRDYWSFDSYGIRDYKDFDGDGNTEDYLVTQAEWTNTSAPMTVNAPAGYVNPISGATCYFGCFAPAGSTIPAGSEIINTQFSSSGATFPAAVFPRGVPLRQEGYAEPQRTVPVTVAAGQTAPGDVVLPSGTAIHQGVVSAIDLPVVAIRADSLAPTLFESGFSSYTVNAQAALTVTVGTQVRATMPVLRLTDSRYAGLDGAALAGAVESWTPPLYQEDAANARLAQRAGADLVLSSSATPDAAGGARTGSISIGRDAAIEVDPGRSVRIASGGQVIVDGRITAPGGDIAVVNNWSLDAVPLDRPGAHRNPGALSVWIGEHAVLDAAGRAVVARDALGRRYGVAPDGGTITVGSEGGKYKMSTDNGAVENGLELSTNAYVVLRPGSVLDASGAAAEFDLPLRGVPVGTRPQTLAGAGGAIRLRSHSGIHADGTMLARAGAAGVAGGELLLSLESPLLRFSNEGVLASPDFVALRAGRAITVRQHAAPALDGALQAGQADEGLALGQASLGLDTLDAGGFDALNLRARDAIVFDGDVTLALGRSLTLQTGQYANLSAGRVTLAAPYVSLLGQSQVTSYLFTRVPDLGRIYTSDGTVLGAPLGATLDVRAGQVADLSGALQFTYADTRIASEGDLRLLSGGVSIVYNPADWANPFSRVVQPTHVYATGDLTLSGARIYPEAGAIVTVAAGHSTGRNSANGTPSAQPVADKVLTLARPEGASGAPAAPYSAFSQLTLIGAEIRQGGALYAPFGSIALNAQTMQAGGVATVSFLPGSITSVSGAGLMMPWGGTVDGVDYTVDDTAVASPNLVTGAFGNRAQQGISVRATHIRSDDGALVDLSGGGELRGAAFVPGRGGSVDTLQYARQAGGQVYAIVPGAVGPAPTQAGYYTQWRGDLPGVGRQITIGEGVPGLPAGTYTLMPANYALLPGAFRVELGGQAGAMMGRAIGLRDGSWRATAYHGLAGTGARDALPTHVQITPGSVARTWSQYNETGYARYQLDRAATFNTDRPMLEADARRLTLVFGALDEARAGEAVAAPALVWDGLADMTPAQGGYGGSLAVMVGGGLAHNVYQDLVITGDLAAAPARTSTRVVLAADDINAFGAPTLYIGGAPLKNDDTLRIGLGDPFSTGNVLNNLILSAGARLTGGQVFLTVGDGLLALTSSIRIEAGSGIDTRGFADVPLIDSSTGFIFGNANPMVVVSNGIIDLDAQTNVFAKGRITMADGSSLYGRGGIGFMAASGVSFEGTPRLGAPRLELAGSAINLGSADGLAQARADGTLVAGIDLDGDLMGRLIAGDSAAGVAGVRELSLKAVNSVNFYGALDLNLLDASGRSLLDTFTLTTPALYGAGAAGQQARLTLDTLIWNTPEGLVANASGFNNEYISAPPGATLPGGPGHGAGSLVVQARRIELGHAPRARSRDTTTFHHLLLGFADVSLQASERIVTKGHATLSAWQSGPSPQAGFDPADYAGVGGNLRLLTPLLTGEAGSVLTARTGGTLVLAAPQGAVAADTSAVDALGSVVKLHADRIEIGSAIALPTGRLTLNAADDIVFAAGARVDLSGRRSDFFDVSTYSWGGELVAESAHGNILMEQGARIDVSASNNDAGRLTFTATDAAAGQVRLGGTLAGTGGAGREGGSIDVRAQHLGGGAAGLTADFATLNTGLDEAGFTERRAFALKQGNLQIDGTLRAHEVDISVDGGSLAVAGHIDASGAAPGIIRLAARDDLTLAGSAQLHAQGTQQNVDDYGQAIEAKNRGQIELTSRDGWLRLQDGATLDVSAPGLAYGQVVLNAGRTGAASGDARIDAAGTVRIVGASSIALNAVQRYELPDGSVIDQSLLDGYDVDSRGFVDAAAGNAALQSRLQGLRAYGAAFHLRPGVEIVSDGDLSTSGDIDLAGYRYGPGADRDPASAGYGAGEPMALVVRAAGNLDIKGSISDGFKGVDGTPATYDPLTDVTTSPNFRFTVNRYVMNGLAMVTDPAGWTVPFNIVNGVNTPLSIAWRPLSPTSGSYQSGQVVPYGTLLTRVIIPMAIATPAATAGLSIQTYAGTPSYSAMSPMAAMQGAGSQSASLRLVAGADVGGADTRALRGASTLGGRGNLRLEDPHFQGSSNDIPVASVLRTGTGSLELLAGGDFAMRSLYGVYTAGSDTGASGLPSGSYLANGGGDLLLAAQGDVTGYTWGQSSGSSFIGDWLVRGGDGEHAAWGVRFGRTTVDLTNTMLYGFSGFGTLGGGNVTVLAGGNAGSMTTTYSPNTSVSTYEALQLTVAGGGRVTAIGRTDGVITGGALVQSGGGDMVVRVGGAFNGGRNLGTQGQSATPGSHSVLTNLRGDIDVRAGSIGAVETDANVRQSGDPRRIEDGVATVAQALGGISVLPGDSEVRLRALGDLVLGAVADPGSLPSSSASDGASSAWRAAFFRPDATSLDLQSGGGNLVPLTGFGIGSSVRVGWTSPRMSNEGYVLLPARVNAMAHGGSIYYGGNMVMELAPSRTGRLDLLGRGGIYGAGLVSTSTGVPATARLNVSGGSAAPNDVASLFRPVWNSGTTGSNFFAWQSGSVEGLAHATDGHPIRLYAVNGDIVNVALGQTASVYQAATNSYVTYHAAARPAWVVAGRDIVNFGQGSDTGRADAAPGLILNVSETDVSRIQAGRDMYYTNVQIGGPGVLEVTAGGTLYQADRGQITSVGPLAEGDARPGATIAIQAGAGAAGPDWATLAALYLDPANQADLTPGRPLADQPGKVAHVYDEELMAWLAARYGYQAADAAGALAYFNTLAPEQQRVFLRNVYYAELKAGGREYNDAAGPRYGSYLRGRQMIAALFPENDAAGQPVARGGDYVQFGGSGVQTWFGGDIQALVPAGQIVVGVQGQVPPSTSGFITQGQGDISLYSQGSILLGLSRIMTTFGGSILAWSATGDINAGRGSKTTVVYTPPKREYDDVGNVALAPQVPSSGAGIATLNPIPEVEPGDVDLIAPLGTIDAGEAGIRVSGNVNIAALQVVNAANIQVQGESQGIPVAAVVNTGALANASAAATTAATAAQDAVSRSRAAAQQALPSIISVQILGFGEGASTPAGEAPARRPGTPVSNRSGGMLQVLGDGELSPAQLARLSPAEREKLGL
ncbi:filamentous hemagglutinin family protein [Bordetella genomosp. 13]|uniref:Filamentous haemagglutinin FhaB/tRNA nuclease CdiA-like TPS domain-containing protein n=1 Tax=Bordetella genomosp. 13 TaxID=463040 RepID=A0A1W6ZCU5_9BORD|nr:filamentous hemagglutinin family protein [Bordetella genomosp. 13]ARP94960.1 hypothetical protein CAL15_11565 [Bordetella genomosp. 13]